MIGVDLGVRLVTMACHRRDGLSFVTCQADGGDALEACRQLGRRLRVALELWQATVVWVERPMGAQPRSVADLMRVMGVVVAAIPMETPVEEITPSAWKRAIGIGGNANKEKVWKWADEKRRLRGYPVALNQHEADALGVVYACLRLSSPARKE